MSYCTRLSAFGLVAAAAFALTCGCGGGGGGGPELPVVSVIATDPAAAEGAADTGSFEIFRTGDTSAELVVHFSVSGGMDIPAATNGVDYNDQATGVALETSATIPAGAPSVTIVIEPVDDSDVESAEAVTLTLSSAPGYAVAAAPANWATVFIVDDEPPQEVSISAPDPDADEKGTDPGTFRIARGGDTTNALTINFDIATGAGQATNGTDYNEQATGGPLDASATIPAGSASINIVVVPVDDAEEEATEAVSLTLVDDMAYSVAAFPDGTAAVLIQDDDTPPEVSISATDAAAEQDSDPGTFEISRVGRTDSALVVHFDIATGAAHATNGADYNDQATGNPLGTSVTIPNGSASIALTIVPVDDAEIEGPETVTLSLLADAAYLVASPPDDTATVSIADNDVPPMQGPFDYGPGVVTEYAWDGSDFVEDTQRTYSYDAGGKVTAILERTWTGASWEDSLRTTYTYNGDDTVNTITVESWDGFSWSVDTTTSCGYSGGRMTSHAVDDVAAGTITWTTFTYTGALMTREEDEESTDGGATWSPVQATDYDYDGLSRLSSGTVWMPNPFGPGWLQLGDLSVTYDAGGRLDTQTIDLDFMGMFQSTVVMGPAAYDATERLQTLEMTVDITATGQDPEHEQNLAECYYGAIGRLQEVIQYEWDDGLADWVLIGRTTQTNTDAGSSHTFEHESATPLANWPVELYGCGDVNPHLWP